MPLPLMFVVPMYNSMVPPANITSYIRYKNCQTFVFNRRFKRAFTPYANTSGEDNQVFMPSPRLPCNNLGAGHFGLSIMWYNTQDPYVPNFMRIELMTTMVI